MHKKILIIAFVIALPILQARTTMPHPPLYELVALTLPEVNYLKDTRLTAFTDYTEALKQLSKKKDRVIVRSKSSAKPLEAYFTISAAVVKTIEYHVRSYFYKTLKDDAKSFEKPPLLDEAIKAPDNKPLSAEVVNILKQQPYLKEFIVAAVSNEILEELSPLIYNAEKNEFTFDELSASLLNDYLTFVARCAIGLASTSTPKENFLAPLQTSLDMWQPAIEDQRYTSELSTISLSYRYEAFNSYFTDLATTLSAALKAFANDPEMATLRSGLIEQAYTLVDCAEFIAGVASAGQRICISTRVRLFRNPTDSKKTYDMAAMQKSLHDKKSPFYTFKLNFLQREILKPLDRIAKNANKEGINLYQNLHKISRR